MTSERGRPSQLSCPKTHMCISRLPSVPLSIFLPTNRATAVPHWPPPRIATFPLMKGKSYVKVERDKNGRMKYLRLLVDGLPVVLHRKATQSSTKALSKRIIRPTEHICVPHGRQQLEKWPVQFASNLKQWARQLRSNSSILGVDNTISGHKQQVCERESIKLLVIVIVMLRGGGKGGRGGASDLPCMDTLSLPSHLYYTCTIISKYYAIYDHHYIVRNFSFILISAEEKGLLLTLCTGENRDNFTIQRECVTYSIVHACSYKHAITYFQLLIIAIATAIVTVIYF